MDKLYNINIGKRCAVVSRIRNTVRSIKDDESNDAVSGRSRNSEGMSLGFSKRSRNSMIKYILNTESPFVAFVTLTYPDSIACDPTSWKKDLDKFRRGIIYHFPEMGWVWRIEPQQSGKPHYHLVGTLDNGEVDLDYLAEIVHKIWCKIIEEDQLVNVHATKTLPIGQDHEALDKYMTKKEATSYGEYRDGWRLLKRRWGVINGKRIQQHEIHNFSITYEELEAVKCVILQHTDYRIQQVVELINRSEGCKEVEFRKCLKNLCEYRAKIKQNVDFFSILEEEEASYLVAYLQGSGYGLAA